MPQRLGPEDLATIDRLLLELVAARSPLPSGLAAFATSVGDPRIRAALEALRADLASGLALSEAAARRSELPPEYGALLAAGEASGDLAGALERLVARAEVEAATRRRFREALAYPAVTLAAAIGGTAAFGWVLGPELRTVFAHAGAEVPPLASFFAAGGTTIAVGLALGGVALLALAPRWLERLAVRRGADLELAAFARSLGSFLGRGAPAAVAVRALRPAHAPALPTGTLDRVLERLEAGATLARALEPEDAFPRALVRAVAAGEGRGGIEPALARFAARAELRFDLLVHRIELFLPLILLGGLGALVAAGALALFGSIQELTRALGSY
jgi:type II secretory pathway component PulF